MQDIAIKHMSDGDLLRHLTKLSVNSPKATMALMALTDDTWFDAVLELRRRYNRRSVEGYASVQETMPKTASGRVRNPNGVEIDPERWMSFLYGQRIALTKVGPLIGRSTAYGSCVRHKGRASLQAVDELACVVGLPLDDVLYAIGSDGERQRVGLHV